MAASSSPFLIDLFLIFLTQWNFSIEVHATDKEFKVRQSRDSLLTPHNVALASINAYVDILESILSSQSQTFAEAIQVGQRELLQIWQWNGTVPPTINRCMHDIISEKAKEAPDRIAVTSWDGELTYGMLEKVSTQLAIRLVSLGVGAGVTVPLCFEKSMWTVVGVLAIMKAGGTFVLTDPHQPEARLQTIAQEVSAKIVLTSHAQADLGSRIAPEAQVVAIGKGLLDISNENLPSEGLPQIPSSTILYIIFTSGKTSHHVSRSWLIAYLSHD